MEIKVSISARVIIQDGNVNVNEILHEAGKFGDLLKKVMAEKIPPLAGPRGWSESDVRWYEP